MTDEAKGDGDYKNVQADKRKDIRAYFQVMEVKEGAEKDKVAGFARNLSPGGMFIATVKPQQKGEKIDVSFRLPFEAIVVSCTCEVMWSKGFDPRSITGTGMGVRFMDLDPAIKEKIEDWAGNSGEVWEKEGEGAE